MVVTSIRADNPKGQLAAARLEPHARPSAAARGGGRPVVLRDGSTVLMRQVRSDDAALLADGFARLSARPRQMRFLTRKNELSPAELRCANQHQRKLWKEGTMPNTTDPTFYRTPGDAIAAVPETLAYVAAYDPRWAAKDAIAVLDCDAASPSSRGLTAGRCSV